MTFRPPPTRPPTIGFVVVTERLPQRRLLVEYDEKVGDDEKQACVTGERSRLIKERSTEEHEPGTSVHRIPDQTVRALNHQSARWIKGRGSSPSDQGEREDAS